MDWRFLSGKGLAPCPDLRVFAILAPPEHEKAQVPMIFNTIAYFLLFLIPAALLFRAVKPAFQPWICAIFGGLFFIYFSVTQIGGIPGAFCLLIFAWESLFSRLYKPGSRLCIVGIIQTLVILVIFKYWNFLTGLLFGPGHPNPAAWHGAFLPLGISFFTFEFIHYAVDRYRGKTEAGTFGQYLAFILFFPTMVAGPIKRYQDFLPKLESPSRNAVRDWQLGITRILAGLAKKFVVADFLTSLTNHLNRGDIAQAQRWILPIWLLAYGMKIYFDFSAYSDIAIGSAKLFGIKVPENFDWPYLRTNIAEFWQHWHMSLYRWLVDYVFIPLGGSRRSPARVYANVLITMFISGLWHGAGLNFVVWGLWHGGLLAGHRFYKSVREKRLGSLVLPAMFSRVNEPALQPVLVASPGYADPSSASLFNATSMLSVNSEPVAVRQFGSQTLPQTEAAPSAGLAGKLAAWALTFALVNVGWAFFCMDLPTGLFFLRRLFLG
jgi:alginate O-acetyltransferase complex protein AlgI